ncbi:MAG: hypothetical protein AB8F95_10080 [Bacteroidia bacterium]
MIKSLNALVVIALLLIGSQVSGQTVTGRLELGKKDPRPNFMVHSPLDNGLVMLGPGSTFSSRNIVLTKYDADFGKSWTVPVLEQNSRKNLDFMTVIGGNILVFVSEFNPKSKVIETYYYRFNLDGEKLDDKTLLAVSPNEKAYRTDLMYVLSSNKRTLLCYRNLENRQEGEKILYFVFDESGEQTRNGEISLRFPDNRFRIAWVRVSNQGNIYFLGKHYHVNRVRDPEDYSYLMFRYDTYSQAIKEYPIELGDRFVNDLVFKVDRNEHIFVTGFYSNRSTDRITGILIQQIDSSGAVITESSEPFGDSFLSNYLSDGQINRGKELRNFRIMDPEEGMILRSDGGMLLVAENFYITRQSFQDRFNTMDRTIYNYGDVILTSISPEGGIEWHAIIDKRQFTEDPNRGSYFSAASANGISVFYEANPPRSLGRNIYFNNIGIEGQVTAREPIIDDFNQGADFVPGLCRQVNNKEALLVYYKKQGRVLSIVRVEL